MGFSIENTVPTLTVFLQGLLSFFSPCVLPIVPLYVSYLSGGAKTVDEDGTIHYPKGRILINTLFFVLGISFSFFLLSFGFTALGRFFGSNQTLFARAGGIVMIFFGLYQLGLFGRSAALEREHRLPFLSGNWAMGPLPALLLGFTFSFAWTPCVGPALGSVLLMAGSAASSARAFLLIAVYTAGFVLPFLAVGLFTGTVLEFFKKNQSVVRYTVKIGAVLLIFMGVMTLTGFMNGITGYLSQFGASGPGPSEGTASVTQEAPDMDESASVPAETDVEAVGPTDAVDSKGTDRAPAESAAGADSEQTGGASTGAADAADSDETGSAPAEPEVVPAPDFTLVDQFGNEHTFSDYKGKTVFLNFWATWCPPCRSEMPDIQQVYEEYGYNEEDLVVLGIAGPGLGQEGSVEEITSFLEENNYTFPVIMDEEGILFYQYGIRAYPTTFMIDQEGNIFGYAQGALTREIMDSIIDQTMKMERR